MSWSYSLNPLYPGFFRISEYLETPTFDFSRFYCTLEKQKGYDPPMVRAKENLKLSYDGLILRKYRILAYTVDFVNVQRVVCGY